MTGGNDVDIVREYNPTYILVNITHAKLEDFVGITAVKGQAVFPLTQTHISKTIKLKVPCKDEKKNIQTRCHGVDLGFAVTLHKIEKQTCERLIVDLKYRPFKPQISFAGFFVAVSRLQRSDSLRIMPLQPKTANLKQLKTLEPPVRLSTWLSGYDHDVYWNPKFIQWPKSLQSTRKRASTLKAKLPKKRVTLPKHKNKGNKIT